jgi:hypothetical protein
MGLLFCFGNEISSDTVSLSRRIDISSMLLEKYKAVGFVVIAVVVLVVVIITVIIV